MAKFNLWISNIKKSEDYTQTTCTASDHDQNTIEVSHFSYAPLFQGPHFLKNAGIEHSLWWFIYWHFICLMTYKKILESLMQIILLRQRQFSNFDKNARATWTTLFFIFCFALGIIHGDRCDRKTPKTIILFK